jgi:hypothetical protein
MAVRTLMGHGHSQPEQIRPSRSWLSFWAVALGTAAFWMCLVWGIHWDSPRTLVSFHGFVHAAIAEQFLTPVSVTFPPENPFYAGRPVAYYWFFQFLAAQLTRLLPWNIFHAFEAIIVVAMATLIIVAVHFGLTFYHSLLAGVLLGYLVVAGTNALGWLFAVVQLLAIAIMAPQLFSTDHSSYLWGIVHPLYSLIRFNDFGGLYGPLLNFFLNLTSRPAALAMLMALIGCLEWTLRSRKWLAYVLLSGTSALTTALSLITGLSAGGALLIGLASGGFWGHKIFPAWRHLRTTQGTTFCTAGIAIMLGMVGAMPTYNHLLTGPSASQMRFWLLSVAGLRHLATVTLSIAPLVILSVVGIRRMSQERRLFLGILLSAACVLLVATITVTLPAGNNSNFFHAAVVLLAVPGAASVLCSEPSSAPLGVNRRYVTGVVLLFLPTLLLLLAAYLHRPPLPVSFDSPRLARLPRDSDLALLYWWVQNQTSPDAVFILDPRYRVAMCGNIAEFPAMTGWAIFTEEPSHYMVEPYPDSKMRFDMAVRLVSGNEPDSSTQAYLLGFNRPVYIVSYHAENGAVVSRLQTLYGPVAFHAGDVSVFKWSSQALDFGSNGVENTRGQ